MQIKKQNTGSTLCRIFWLKGSTKCLGVRISRIGTKFYLVGKGQSFQKYAAWKLIKLWKIVDKIWEIWKIW